jgi:hypothetical protein
MPDDVFLFFYYVALFLSQSIKKRCGYRERKRKRDFALLYVFLREFWSEKKKK